MIRYLFSCLDNKTHDSYNETSSSWRAEVVELVDTHV